MKEVSLINEPVSRADWTPFYLDFEALKIRLANVKREFGLRKAISTKSMKGETRTLAEILDKEVEKIVLFYLRIQGALAERTWNLREKQVSMLKGDTVVTEQQIEIMCQHFRDLSYEVIELLEFLDFNVLGLRRIIKRHDRMFDLKMGRIYFDSRLQGGGKNSPLIQLYHQEGIRAIVATLRKGFEDLHEAKIDLNSIKNWQLNKNSGTGKDDGLNYGAIADSGSGGSGGASAYSGYGYIQVGLSRISSSGSLLAADQIPRTRYLTRLKASNSVPQLDDVEALEETVKRMHAEQQEQTRRMLVTNSGSYYDAAQGLRRVSSWLSGRSLHASGSRKGLLLTRTVSDLEPCLRRLADTQEKVVRSQQRTTSEYLATHSIMALENQQDGDEEDDDEAPYMSAADSHNRVTSRFGLFLHLLVTFLYMANQYVVAPTSAEYSRLLGEDAAMSGLIIGLSPAAALVSALVYSIWTNYSFRDPLIAAVTLAVIGNLMYALAYQMRSSNMLFFGRIISGLGAPRGIARRYISDHVAVKHRTLASSHFVTASALGLAFGPLISSVVTYADVDLTYSAYGVTLVSFVNVTAPGWIMFTLWLIVLQCTVTGYSEPLATPLHSPANSPRAGSGVSTFFASIIAFFRGRHDYEPIHGLHENVISIELGEMLEQDDIGGSSKRRTHSMSSDFFDGALTMEEESSPVIKSANRNKQNKSFESGGSHVGMEYEDSISVSPEHSLQYVGHDDHHYALRAFPPYVGPMKEPLPSHPPMEMSTGRDSAKRDRVSLWKYLDYDTTMILLVYFVNKTGQEMVVSCVPLLTGALFGWNYNYAGFFMAGMGALVLPATIFISRLKEVEERALALWLFYSTIVAVLVILNILPFEYSPFQYSVGSVMLFSFLCAQEGVIMSLLSKIIPPEMARGTLNSGFLTTEVGTLGRVMSDIAITWVVSGDLNANETVNHLFMPVGAAVLVALILFQLNYENYSI